MSIITREIELLPLFLAFALLFVCHVFGPEAMKWLGPLLWREP
jgi:hypothetical protein